MQGHSKWGVFCHLERVKICISGRSPQLIEDWGSEYIGVSRIGEKVSWEAVNGQGGQKQKEKLLRKFLMLIVPYHELQERRQFAW